MSRRARAGARRAPGWSLVELMLAIALGLLLCAALGAFAVQHIGEQRRLIAQSRLAQELRAALDLAVRDVRRSAYWGEAERGLWRAPDGPLPAANPYAGLHPAPEATGTALGHAYSRDATENGQVDANERFGLRVNASTQALEWRVAGGALAPGTGDQWQALTDPGTVRIDALEVHHESVAVDLGAACAGTDCSGVSAGTPCPPQLRIHQLTLRLSGRDARDDGVRRTLLARVRLRNEERLGACPPA